MSTVTRSTTSVRSGPKNRSSSSRAASTPTGSSPGDTGTAGHHSSGNVFSLGGGVTGWQEGSGIGSGLARPGPRGTLLRRASDAYRQHPSNTGGESTYQMANTKLAEFVVRFLRLSALVAMELGREAVEDRSSVDGNREGRREEDPNHLTPRPPTLSPQAMFRDLRSLPNRPPSDINSYGNALRPSREWYFLLAGLVTRTVLEGYITGGWVGIEPLEVLLGIGLGISPMPEGILNGSSNGDPAGHSGPGSPPKKKDREPFLDFDPDDLPELDDAARILFPTLREVSFMSSAAPTYQRREGTELEYEIEMTERLRRVCSTNHELFHS